MDFTLEDRAAMQGSIQKDICFLSKNYGMTYPEYLMCYSNIERIYDYALTHKEIPKEHHGLTMMYIAHECFDILKSVALAEQQKKPGRKLKIYPRELDPDEIIQYYVAMFVDVNKDEKENH